MNFRHVWNIFAVVILLFVIGTPLAMAQDATEEAPAGDVVVVDDVVVPVDEAPAPTYEERATVTLRDAVISIMLVAGAIIATIAGALGGIVLILSRTLAKIMALALERIYLSVPSYLQPSLASAVGGGLDKLEEEAKKTSYKWDDEFVQEFRARSRSIIKEELVSTSNELLEKIQAITGKVPPNIVGEAVG